MNDGATKVVEGEKPVQTDAEKAAATAEAEAGFAAGFGKVHGGPKVEKPAEDQTDTTTDTTTGAAPAAEAGAKPDDKAPAAAPAAAAAPVEDPWKDVPKVVRDILEPLGDKLRNIDGRIGGLNGGVKELKTALEARASVTGTGAAPTQTEVAGAAASSEKWKKLKEDFPEWAEAMEERLAQGGKPAAVDVEGLKRAVTGDVQAKIDAGVDQAEERAFVRLKHPDWRKTINSAEFTTWRKSQPADSGIEALCASDLAEDTLKVLDGFAAHRKKVVDDETRRQKNQRRLEGAAVPAGAGAGTAQTGLDDEAAFNLGFNKVVRKASK